MKSWVRHLLLVAVLVSTTLPFVFALFRGDGPHLFIPQSLPSQVAAALGDSSDLPVAPTKTKRLPERVSEVDSAVFLMEAQAAVLQQAGRDLSFDTLFHSETLIVLPPDCDLDSLGDLLHSPCPVQIATEDSGRTFLAVARALAPASQRQLLDDADWDTRSELLAQTAQTIRSHNSAAAGDDAPIVMTDLNDLTAPHAVPTVVILPSEWAPSVAASMPKSRIVRPKDGSPIVTFGIARTSPHTDFDTAAARKALAHAPALPPDTSRHLASPPQPLIDVEAHAETVRLLDQAHRISKDIKSGGRSPAIPYVTLYTGLFLALVAWGVSLYWRVPDLKVRRLLLLMDTAMVAWCGIRLMKLAAPAWAEVSLWLMYYVAALTIMTLTAHLSVSLAFEHPGRRVQNLLSGVNIVSTTLAVTALTTQMHGLFVKVSPTWSSGDPYWYGPAYFAYIAWVFLVGMASWVLAVRSAGRDRRWWMLAGQLAALLALAASWVLQPIWIGPVRLELTFLALALLAVMWELALRSGRIPTAGRYRAAFEYSVIPAQLLDRNGSVLKRTSTYVSSMPAQLTRPDVVEYEVPLAGGVLQWQLDLSEVRLLHRQSTQVHQQLRRRWESLSRRRDLASLQSDVDRRTRALNMVDDLTRPCLLRAAQAGLAIPGASPAQRARLLRATAVDLAYAKQVGKLVLQTVDMSMIENGTERESDREQVPLSETVPMRAEKVRARELFHAMELLIADFNCPTHAGAIVAPADVRLGTLHVKHAVAALGFVHVIVRVAAEPDGADALIHVTGSGPSLRIRGTVELEAGVAAPPAWLEEELSTNFATARCRTEDAALHFDFSVRRDAESLADAGVESC